MKPSFHSSNPILSRARWIAAIALSLSTTGLMACSDSAEAEKKAAAAAAASLQETTQELGRAEKIESPFIEKSEPAQYAAVWPYGFDNAGDELRATILALGDVAFGADGSLSLEATPYHTPDKGLVEKHWSYELVLDGLGRSGDSTALGSPEAAIHEPSSLIYRYKGGVDVLYKHRTDGLKLFVQIDERQSGEGPLEVRFSQRGEGLALKADKDELVAFYKDSEAFRWSGLIAFDANGVDLPVSLESDEGSMRFIVDDSHATYPITVDPLATSPSWSLSGTKEGSKFPENMVTGDVNGDGRTDILVSDTFFTDDLTYQGRALLYLGQENGFGHRAAFVVVGDTLAEQLGVGLDMSADFAGDGCDEIIIGAPAYRGGLGRVLHYRPFRCDTPDPDLYPNLLWSKEGEESQALFGRSVSTGDYNCDGTPDLLISAPRKSAAPKFVVYSDTPQDDVESNVGEIYIFDGNRNLPHLIEDSPSFSHVGAQKNEEYGWTTTTIPEVNGQDYSTPHRCDGFAAGSLKWQQNSGRVDIYYHDGDGQINPEPESYFDLQAGFELASSLEAIPSPRGTTVNGRTLSALAIGAAALSSNDLAGHVSIIEYSEAVGRFVEIQRLLAPSYVEGDKFGVSIAGNIDLNDDSYPDIVVGARGFSFDLAESREGAAFVYLGTGDGFTALPQHILGTSQEQSEYGHVVAGVPDFINGNDALLVGARQYDDLVPNGGKIFLYAGEDTCRIDGEFYQKGATHSDNICLVCDPSQSREDWSLAEDGMACETSDGCTISTCQAGECVEANEPICEDDPCMNTECDPGEPCMIEPYPDGTPCGDSGLSCADLVCQDGQCVHEVTAGCMIEETCFEAGAANPASECFHCDPELDQFDWSPRPANTPCEADAFCTVNAFCDGEGTCRGEPRECDIPCYESVCSNAENACVPVEPLADGTECDDGDLCTTRAECLAGVCIPRQSKHCPGDGDRCTLAVCDPATGECGQEVVPDWTSCDPCAFTPDGAGCDGDDCTVIHANDNGFDDFCDTQCQAHICLQGVCEVIETVNCSELDDECQVGMCDPDTGACSPVFVEDGTSCNDGFGQCISGDCRPFECTPGNDEQCDDDNPCTIGECTDQGTCTFTAREDGYVCDRPFCLDENSAVSAATCIEGGCIGGPPEDCGDYMCDEGVCLSACEGDEDCFGDATCTEEGECVSENQAPIADAGPDQDVNDGDVVTLDGTASYDPDGDELEYSWVQVSGEEVELSDASSDAPTFTAPRAPVDGELVLVFELTVNDGEDDSEPSQTQVTVTNSGNEPPVAQISGPTEAAPGQTITLDGSESFDPDGDEIQSYQWSLIERSGPAPTITQAAQESAVNITFPAESEFTGAEQYLFGLIVSDGLANSPREGHEVIVIPTGEEPGDDVGPEPGDDVGPEPGDDVGLGDDLPPPEQGSLQGSGFACSGVGGGNDPQGMAVFAAALGLLWWRRRRG